MEMWKQTEKVPVRLSRQSVFRFCAQWGKKKQDLGTNLNTDGVIILWPFHCAIKINFFQWGQKGQQSKIITQ